MLQKIKNKLLLALLSRQLTTALATATTAVQQSQYMPQTSAIVEITQAQTEYSQAQGVTAEVASKISVANTEIT
jgi:hypothetical protein